MEIGRFVWGGGITINNHREQMGFSGKDREPILLV